MNSKQSNSIEALFQAQKDAFALEPFPSARLRKKRLNRLKTLLLQHKTELAELISQDFGCRSPIETALAEVFTSLEGINYQKRHLGLWMKPEDRAVSLWFFPGRCQVYYQPKGVVGIIAPWNYPLYLTLGPLSTALAAGNRAMLKLPEQTPLFSERLAQLIGQYFAPEEVVAVTGGPQIGQDFSAIPWDHLFFTGSTEVGKKVMAQAAKNLVPVTLELGGKSPCIITPGYPAAKAAERILVTKALNAGQTCIAPDYLLVPKGELAPLITAFKETMALHYPSVEGNLDYTSIINKKHFDRLEALYKEALALGAKPIPLLEGPVFFGKSRKIVPTLLTNVTGSMRIMQEEIFGPFLPILEVENFDAALNYVALQPRPLAAYLFSEKRGQVKRFLEQVHAGGVVINHCLYHVAQDDLPFGGLGPSGMGRYHGFEGFQTFSNAKSVYRHGFIDSAKLTYPPYGKAIGRLLKLMLFR